MALQKKYYTYIVKCADLSYYAGKTNNLNKRIRQHNGEIKGGAKYTRIRRPVELVFHQEFNTHADACNREAQIKRLTHTEKIILITNT